LESQKKREIYLFLEELKRFLSSNPEWVVLVEGKRDKAALERFGVEPITQMAGRNYHDIAEELTEKYRGVVLLTDLDEQGERIKEKLTKILESYGLLVDSSPRGRLKRAEVRFIESLLGFKD
jgi:5S rRNA maturation endonuclease (ribonuclease M5)